MMHLFHTVLEGAALLVDAAASVIMVWGFLVAIYAFVQASFNGSPADRIMKLQAARCALGINLIFALELLIISDLLHTVVSHSLDDLWFLAALVVIRTVISFFLNREIQEVEAEIQR